MDYVCVEKIYFTLAVLEQNPYRQNVSLALKGSFVRFLGVSFGILLWTLVNHTLSGQQDSSGCRWIFTGYLEAYGGLDLPRSPIQRRPSFLYSYTTTGMLALNLVYLNMAYEGQRLFVRGGLMGGTYAWENLASEPPLLRHIQEACVGWKPDINGRIEVLAGIFPSHIGAETVRGVDGYTLTRSIQADNSPYYESGMQVSFTSPEGKYKGAFLFLNGWQRMTVPARFRSPALGHSFSCTGRSWRLGSHSIIGPARQDDLRSLRLFHNFQMETTFGEDFSLLAVIDVGWAPFTAGGLWWSPTLMARLVPSPNWRIALRGEWFQDPARVITPSSLSTALEAGGLSFNLDWRLTPVLWWRAECRSFLAPQPLFFTEHNTPTRYYFALTTAVMAHIEQVLRPRKRP